MLKNAQIIKYDLTINITWKCPYCNTENHLTNFTMKFYRIPAEDLPDVMCTNCSEFSSLSSNES